MIYEQELADYELSYNQYYQDFLSYDDAVNRYRDPGRERAVQTAEGEKMLPSPAIMAELEAWKTKLNEDYDNYIKLYNALLERKLSLDLRFDELNKRYDYIITCEESMLLDLF
jgi:hypothetical protein